MTPTDAAPDPTPVSAVVTGAARGIGRGIAEKLIARGYRVVITDVDAEAVRRTAEEIGAAAGLGHDVSEPEGHRAVARVAAEHGTLAVWVNNAGVGYDGALAELDEESIARLVSVNLMGPIWGTRAALAAFGPAGGDVVNTASLSGLGPVPGLSVYAATKAGVVSLSMSVNAEAPANVRVHALCPDGVATEMVASMKSDGRALALVASGGRMLTVDEVAESAVRMINTNRVVRTLPGWRGALLRWSALTPHTSMRMEPLMRRQGQRAVRRAGR